MAFKMKGMSFGKGTSYKSPQAMKKESAMKMAKKDSAMDMAKRSPMDMAKKSPMKKEKTTYTNQERDALVKASGVSKEEATKMLNKKFVDGRRTEKGEVVKGGTKTFEQGNKAAGGKLNQLVADRKKHKKGSAEYNAIQNQINKALGSKKRHGQTSATTKDTSRTTKTTTKTPGIGTKDTKVVKDTKGTTRKIKEKEKDLQGNVTAKSKQKFDAQGNRVKKKEVTKTEDTVTKFKVKDKKLLSKKGPAKVKTRKRGGTGIGAAIKSKLADRKARRAKQNA